MNPLERRLPSENERMDSRDEAHLWTPKMDFAETMPSSASRICCYMREVYEATGRPNRGCPCGIAE